MLKIESYLKKQIDTVLKQNNYPKTVFQFDRPRLEAHGDISVNVAMLLSRELKQNPRQIAEKIKEQINPDPKLIADIKIAGPGFINFFLAENVYRRGVKDILDQAQNYGRLNWGSGKKAQIEFVSANPTGPLTVGHGRQAILGDTIGNLLDWSGYRVTREYYFNNAGRQMRVLAESVRLRYLEILGEKIDFTDDHYQGEYIKAIARELFDKHGNSLAATEETDIFQEAAEASIFADIKNTLKRLGVVFDIFFNESDLYENGDIDKTIRRLKAKNLAYEKDGALWFRATEFGGEQDRVIVKSSGEPTYRLPDIAYHCNKLERGFDLIIDLFGADHIATYPDVLAGVKALGYDAGKIRVLIHQFVTLFEGREKVKMSTRKANFITLDELVDEVGPDVTRWFFLMRSMQSHLNFDLKLAKTESDENPVYYNQYAHARICSILRNAETRGIRFSDIKSLAHISEKSEFALVGKLMDFPRIVRRCATDFEPHLLTEYMSEVAGAFHKFYTECRVINDDKELTQARLAVCLASRQVLANGFAILGIHAPEKM